MTEDRSSRTVETPPNLDAGGATDRGRVRKENQDVWSAVLLGDGRLALLLADGMGGHNGGREAAEAAVAAAERRLGGAASDAARDTSGLLAGAVERANLAVRGVRDNLGGVPGTTLVIAVIEPDAVSVANVGDSRAYLVREGRAIALTSDHTWVGEEVRAGRLPPGSERGHPRRNVLSRAVLGDPVAADVGSHRWRRGDTLVLCSDGVWEPLDDGSLAAVAEGDASAAELASAICDAALAAGATDNVTTVVARRVR